MPATLVKGLRAHWLLGAGLVAVVALIFAVHPLKLLRALEGADPGAILLMLPCVLLLYFFHGCAWWLCLRRIGAQAPFRTAQQVTFLSQAFVFLPGGDLWRVPILRRAWRSRVPNARLVGTVVFDDLVFMLVLSFGMLPALLQVPALAVPFGLLLAPQLAVFAILASPSVYRALARRVGGLRPVRRFEPQLQLLGPTVRVLLRPRTLLPVLAIDAVCAALTVSLFALAVAAVHAGGPSLQRVVFTFSASQVAASLAVFPAALGAYEGLVTGLLSVQGLAPAAAAAAALLYRTVNDALMAVVGLGVAVASKQLAPAEPELPRPAARLAGHRASGGGIVQDHEAGEEEAVQAQRPGAPRLHDLEPETRPRRGQQGRAVQREDVPERAFPDLDGELPEVRAKQAQQRPG